MRGFFDYLGAPYRSRGMTPAGWDCLGLVVWCSREHFGRVLPDYSGWYASAEDDNSSAIERGRSAWLKIAPGREVPGDVLILKIEGLPLHLGLVIGAGHFLHVMRGRDTVIESSSSRVWAPRVAGVVRWVA